MRDLMDVILGVVVLSVVAGVIFGIYRMTEIESAYEQRLMHDCMKDGHKEWECESMLRRHYRMVGKTLVPD